MNILIANGSDFKNENQSGRNEAHVAKHKKRKFAFYLKMSKYVKFFVFLKTRLTVLVSFILLAPFC